jgi:hypothetical protein
VTKIVIDKIRLKRGLFAHMPMLYEGEPYFAEDTNDLWIGTGNGNKRVVDSTVLADVMDAYNQFMVPSTLDKMNNLTLDYIENHSLDYNALKLGYVDAKLEPINASIKNLGVYVDDYGAKADGVTDDTQAFIDAFNYAKGKNLKVLASGSQYYFSNTQTINVYNDADFGGAKFIIDDTKGNGAAQLFTILHDNPSYVLDSTTFNAIKTSFIKTATKIPQLAGLGNIIVYLYDNTTNMYIREGGNANSGVNKFDHITIDNEGYITSKLTWDFSNVTSITIQPMDDKVLKFGNFTAVSSNNVPYSTASYINKGVKINRSNVIIERINHRVASDSLSTVSARNGFIFPQYCANVVLKDISLQPLKTQTDGTYEFGGYAVINISVDNMNSQSFDNDERWGSMGTNFFKNVTIENSRLNRIDSHMGLHNLTIKNCELGIKGISVVGFGVLSIENVKAYSNDFIGLRSDYGGFWNGDIFIKNVFHKPFSNSGSSIITSTYKYDFNYGYNLMMGVNIISIQDYVFDNTLGATNPSVVRVNNGSAYSGTVINYYQLPKTIDVRNIKMINGASGSGFIMIGGYDISLVHGQTPTTLYADGTFTPNIIVKIDNVDFGWTGGGNETYSNLFSITTNIGFDGTDNYSSDLNRLYYRFIIKNTEGLFPNLRGMYAYMNIDNCTVKNLKCNNNGSRSFVTVSNSLIRPIANSFSESIFKGQPQGLFFSNCFFTKVYYSDNTAVSVSSIPTNYNFLALGSVGTTALVNANLSGCAFDPNLDWKTVRSDIELTDFRFGSNVHTQKFPLKKGTTAQRPPSTDIRASFLYYDTTLNKPIWFDGTAWKDSTGTTV